MFLDFFHKLQENIPSLKVIPDSILIPHPADPRIVIAERRDNFSVAIYVQSNKVEELFALYKKEVPRAVKRILARSPTVLIDIDSIQTNKIRLYVGSRFYDVRLERKYPISPETSIPNSQSKIGIGFYIDAVNDMVEDYKHYYRNTTGSRVYNYRFKEDGTFIDKFTETSVLGFTDFSDYEILNGIDMSNTFCAHSKRTDVDHTYLTIYPNSMPSQEPANSSSTAASTPPPEED